MFILLLFLILGTLYFFFLELVLKTKEYARVLLFIFFYFFALYYWFSETPFSIYFVIGIPILNLLFFTSFRAYFSQGSGSSSIQKAILQASPISSIENVFEGILVTGAAGSGKTQSVITNILTHYAKFNFSGIIYDYKDFELTEIAYPMYKNNKNIAFHCLSFEDIQRTSKINPIAPKYVENEDTMRTFFQVIYENIMGSSNEKNPFFKQASISAVSAMAWKLYQDDPKNCNLPFITGLFTNHEPEFLGKIIQSNKRAKALGSSFLAALHSPETKANLQASISNFLSFFLTPEKFYVLSEDGIDLRINHPKHQAVISLINNPAKKEAYSPVLSSIVGTIIKQMSHRDSSPSFVLLDEAPTLKLQNASSIPATLRSYSVSTLYCLQDKSLSDEIHGENTTRAILSNLSHLYIGRSLDERSSKMFENLSSLIKEKQLSTSYNKDLLEAKTRLNESQRERHRIRADDFLKFKAGEFYNFSNGKEKKIKFPFHQPVKDKPPMKNQITDIQLEDHYLHILKLAENYQNS